MALLPSQVLKPRSGSAIAGFRQFGFEPQRNKLRSGSQSAAVRGRGSREEDDPKSRLPHRITIMQRLRGMMYRS
jgi:hypothetical protein